MIETLLPLLQRAFVGRLALSFLPPGELGSHRPSAWPATWAASHLVGGVVSETVGAWCALAGWRLDARAGAGLVALALVVRWLSLPGGLVPRHPPARERAGFATWALRATWLGVLVALDLPPTASADLLAAGLFVEHALATARRAPAARALLVLTWTLLAVSSAAAGEVLAAAGTSAGWVAWRRRADGRGLALVALALGSLAGREPWLAATAAAVALACSAAPARRRAALLLLVAGLVVATPRLEALERDTGPLADAVRSAFAAAIDSTRAWGFWAAVALALGAAGLGVSGASRAGRDRRAVDPPERELAGLALWVALAPLVAIGACAAFGAWPPERSESFLAALGASAAVLIGLVACPDERVERPLAS